MRWFAGVVLLVGCYASHEITGECPEPDGLASPVVERIRTSSCVIEGSDEAGVFWSEVCDGSECTLSRDGEEACACVALDFANTCANGIPTCEAWRYFDYTDVTFVHEDDP